MACYHLSVKPISRSGGRSVCAASAYRAGERIYDPRAEIEHDYTRRQGIEHSEIIGFDGTRQELWGQTELVETRKNARLAVEAEIALPTELSANQRRELVLHFGAELAREYGAAVDVAIHAPHREGDERNHHAHVLVGCRKVEGDRLTGRVVPFDGPEQVERWREKWAAMQNQALEMADQVERVDHRSNERRRIEAEPTRHLGPQAMAAERAAEREAMEQGREYQPITEQGQHNAMTRAENVRRWIERQLEVVHRAKEKAERLLERVGFRLDRAVRRERLDIPASAETKHPTLDEKRERAREALKSGSFQQKLAAGLRQRQEDRQKEIERQLQLQRDRGIGR